ncbi:MAG: type II toxin-antitoxin system HicA family toxin [Halobacteriales archaeon]
MPTTDFSGRDIVKVLRKHGYHPVGRTGSHVKLRYEHPENPDDVRVVTVPQYDRVPHDILRKIADQCEADDFSAWCEWIDSAR